MQQPVRPLCMQQRMQPLPHVLYAHCLPPSFCSVCAPFCTRSRCLLMIITQEPAQPLATLHMPTPTSFREPRKQQEVGLPLMISFGMVMLNVLVQRPPQRALTKED